MKSINVLNIIDCHLSVTMNWLERLLLQSSPKVNHFVFAKYFLKGTKSEFVPINKSILQVSYPIPLHQKIQRSLSDHTLRRELRSLVLSKMFEVVHVHFGHVALEFVDLLLEMKVKIFISLYGFDYEYLIQQNPEIRDKYVHFAKSGCHFIVEGNYSTKLLISYGVPATLIHKVHLLFPFAGGISKPIHWFKPIKLIQAASYTEKKGQDILVEALRPKNRNLFSVNFYGEQVEKDYFKSLTAAVNDQTLSNISINDHIPFLDYQKKLSQAHIAVSLSHKASSGDTEGGCPVFIRDALFYGKPVLTTFHCDIPDLFVHSYNSWMIRENDVQDASEALDEISFLSSRDYQRMAWQAMESVHSKSNSSGNELIDVYSSLL